VPVAIGLDVVSGEETDVWICITEQRNQLLTHQADKATMMALFEFHRAGTPAQGVAEPANWNFAAFGVGCVRLW
jgi:hypothetical protein